MFGAILGGIGALMSAGSAMADRKENKEIDERNFQYQKENNEWMKEQHFEKMRREDSSVSRRAKDLENAGLSKTLAAGSGAQSSAPISPNAPQRSFKSKHQEAVAKSIQSSSMAMHLMQQKANISKTAAEQNKIEEEASFIKDSKEGKLKDQDLKNEFSERTLETRIKQIDSNLTESEQRIELIKSRKTLADAQKSLTDQKTKESISKTVDNYANALQRGASSTKIASEIAVNEAKIKLIESQTQESNVRRDTTQRDLDIYKETGKTSHWYKNKKRGWLEDTWDEMKDFKWYNPFKKNKK